MALSLSKILLIGVLFAAAPAVHAQAVPSGGSPDPASGLKNPVGEVSVQDVATPIQNVITVRGRLERKSSWRRAEGDHAIVYSNGLEADLRRVTEMLDREFAVLENMFGQRAQDADIPRPTIVLIGGSNFERALQLVNIRSEEGPYARPFRFQRYYDPRIGGAMIAVGRSDQFVPVAAEALAVDPFQDLDDAGTDADYDYDEFDADPTGAISSRNLRRPLRLPHVDRAWEGLVYSAFAQDYVLSRFPASYPRWYLDGLGALFSTLAIGADGSTEYGRTPDNFAAAYNSSPVLPASAIVAGETAAPLRAAQWTPYQAWVLAHYFLLGDLPPERRGGLAAYLRSVAGGEAQASAAARLGEPAILDSEVKNYAEGSTYFFSLPDAVARRAPTLTTLSPHDADLLRARVELGAMIETGRGADTKASRRRDEYLSKLAETVAGMPDQSEALAVLAEAECGARLAVKCAATAARLVAAAPDDPRGLAWQAMALTEKAIAAQPDTRPAAFDAALRSIIAANRADNDSVIPLLAFFRLYAETGRKAPEKALLGMMKIVEEAPNVASLRLALGRELAAQGYVAHARRILQPIAFAGYVTPEQAEAAQIMRALPAQSD